MTTSIKVKFRPSTVASKKGTIYYQVIHGRNVRQIHTEYKIYPDEWRPGSAMPVCRQGHKRYKEISTIRQRIYCDINLLTKIANRLELSGSIYCIDDIVNEYHIHAENHSLFHFMKSVIISLNSHDHRRTAENYASTLSSFRKFMKGEDILLDNVTSELLQNYETFLTENGMAPNTKSFYMRILRATYNRAVDKGIIDAANPFRHVSTGIYRTNKRALSIATIRRIRDMNLSDLPKIDYARDMFMMSFYTGGMSFVDMAYLRKSDLKNGYVTYRRRKTGQSLTIKWTNEMQIILDKYPVNPTQYLLPIIRNPNSNPLYSYRNKGYAINYNLKLLGEMVGASIPITLYCARHSWASAARTTGIPISLISEGMGHDSESTTQIYLAAIDTTAIDNANSLVIKAVGQV